MDPDFGIRTWYLKPSFYFKLLWGILSLSIVIYNIVLCWMTFDSYFNRAVGTGPGTLAIFIFIFVIISIAGNVITMFKLIPRFHNIILYASCGTTVFTMILGIIYASVFGNNTYEDKADQKAFSYLFKYPNNPETIWFKKHIAGSDVGALYDYCDRRCTGAGEALLGLLITWFILQCFLLFVYLQENELAGYAATEPLNQGNTETYSK